ncbi:MAG: PAS domain-containing protein [Verrucomicrobiales bacterium]|nr:PAS domain-containing protein [Verrucomicrobiales bacterium]
MSLPMYARWLSGSFLRCLALVVVLLPASVMAQPAPAASGTVLRDTASIQALPIVEAARGLPVEIDAVVSFSEPTWRLLFVEDNTGGIYCETQLVREFPPAGTRVRLRGTTDGGAFLPFLVIHQLENLGPAPPLVPRLVSADELWAGHHDGDLVKVRGVVLRTSTSTNPPAHVSIDISGSLGTVSASLLGAQIAPSAELVGAVVEVTGVFAPSTDDQRQITKVGLLASSTASLVVLTNAAETARTLPVSTGADLFPEELGNHFGPLRLRGQILFVHDQEVWIGSASNSAPVHFDSPPSASEGQLLDVLAVPTEKDGVPTLDAVRILEQRSGERISPTLLNPGELLDPRRYGQLVTVEGQILHRGAGTSHEIWVLSYGDRTFEACPVYPEPRVLLPGTRVRISGLRTQYRVTPQSPPLPRILIARAADVAILSPPPWPLRRTLGAVSILSGCLALGLVALAFSYRRQRESARRAERAESDLREFNLHLERRISERTAELAAANRTLQAEITEKQRAQAELADREARLRHAQSLLRVGSFHWSAPAQIVTWSDELYRIFGRDPGTFRPSFEAYLAQIHPDDRESVSTRIQEALRTGKSFTHDYRFVHPSGSLRWATAASRVLFDERGQVIGLEGTCQDVTARKLEEQFRAEQAKVLESIAHGAPLSKVFEALLRAVECQADGMLCSIMLVDADGRHLRHAAAPSLPESYCRAVDGLEIGPSAGSCGTAAHRRERVVVEDVEQDPLWKEFCHLALPEGLRACWSEPIFDSEGRLLGTFASYFRTPQGPTPQQLVLITSATHTAAIGIERERNERSLRDTTETLRQRNEMLQRMERMAQVGAWSIDVRAAVLHWSEEVYRIHDLPLTERPSIERAIEFYAPEARHLIREAVERGCRDGTPWDLELPFITAGGRRLWVRAQGQAEFDQGVLVRLHGAFQDITQRRAAAEELRASEERFQLAMRGANDGLWDWDLRTDHAYFSPRWKSMLGYTDAELPNHLDSWGRLVDPDQRDQTLALARDAAEGRIPHFECEFRMRHKAGHWVDILSRAFVLRDESGAPLRIVGTHVDITERKRIDSALRALASGRPVDSETNFLRDIVRQLSQLYGMRIALAAEFVPGRTDRIRTLAVWDDGEGAPNFERDLLGTPCLDALESGLVVHTQDVTSRFPLDPLLRGRGIQSYIGVSIHDRHRVPIGLLALLHPLPIDRSPNLDPILKLFAERVGAELERNRVLGAAQAAEARFRSAIEHSFEGLSLTEVTGRCTYVSPAITRITGYSRDEILGRQFADLIHPEDRPAFDKYHTQLLQTPDAYFESEFRIHHRDGSFRWVQTSVTNRLGDPDLGAIVSNIRDVTAQKQAAADQARLESQLRQAQKMEAIGTLAGGIAHDFNNILGAIIGHTQLARMDVETLPAARENLDDALVAAKRARDLIKQILAFSRRGEPERRVIQLKPLFEESLRLLRAALPATAELVTQVHDPVPDVLADPTLVQQVILNLATNAAQAIGDQPGQIRVVLEGVHLIAPFTPGTPDLPPGRYARLTVIDNGPGMDAATLERVFEPFFTTKPAGQGTGLGLAVVHGIIENHHGAVRAQSNPGQGSTFEIYLPAAETNALPSSPPNPSAESPTEPRRGRILVVDDEPSLLRITERILGLEGYQVSAFTNPIEARLAFLRAPGDFDLLITDYLMPGQNGVDLARQLTDARPEFPMIICTGHSFGLTRERAAELGFRDLLHKPVEFESLRRAVRAILS